MHTDTYAPGVCASPLSPSFCLVTIFYNVPESMGFPILATGGSEMLPRECTDHWLVIICRFLGLLMATYRTSLKIIAGNADELVDLNEAVGQITNEMDATESKNKGCL